MRFTELTVPDYSSWVLHPHLNVLEADASTQHALRAALAALHLDPDAPGVGYVDVHGLELFFDGRAARLLALDGAVDLAINSTDLPHVGPRSTLPPPVLEEWGDPGDVARRTLLGAEAVRDEILDRLAALSPEGREAQPDTADLSTAERRYGAAAQALAEAEAELVAAASATSDPAEEPEDTSLADADTELVTLAVANYDRLCTSLPDQSALDLADAIEALDVRRQELLAATTGATAGERRAAAVARVDAARDALDALHRAGHRGMVEPAARHRIEALHEQVLAMQDKADRKLLAGAARKRLIELRTEETDLLSSYGLNSFSDYLLTSSTSSRPDPAAELRVTLAEADLSEAQAALDALGDGDGHDPALATVLDQIQSCEERAVELLGEDVIDVVAALRAVRRTRTPSSVELESALALVGVAPVGVSPRDAAEAWLLEVDEARRRRAALESGTDPTKELSRPSALDLARARRDVAESELNDARAELEHLHEVHQARVAAAALSASTIAARIEELRSELADAEAAVEAARIAHDEATVPVAPPAVAFAPPMVAPLDPIATEQALIGRIAGHRHVGFVGPVPVILIESFEGADDGDVLRLLGRLERLAGAVQIVHLTAHSVALDWAEGLGTDRCYVSRARSTASA